MTPTMNAATDHREAPRWRRKALQSRRTCPWRKGAWDLGGPSAAAVAAASSPGQGRLPRSLPALAAGGRATGTRCDAALSADRGWISGRADPRWVPLKAGVAWEGNPVDSYSVGET